MTQFSPQQMMEAIQALMKHVAEAQGARERAQLLEAELKSREAIRDQFVLMSETDTRGVITYANPKFCQVSGYTLEELVGRPHNIVRHPDMPREVFKDLWETIKAGKIWQGEVKNRRKDGSHYWVLATVGPIFNNQGEIVSYVSNRIEITHQKDLEEKLAREKERVGELLDINLRFAGEIQSLLLPPFESAESSSLPYFIYWKPLSHVSGDFAYIHEDKNRVLVFLGDSIGHGVSGGFISTLFTQEIRHLVEEKGVWSPEFLAEELDRRLGRFFHRRLPMSITVDGTIALVDLNRKRLHYLSLKRQNFLWQGGEISVLPAYPFSFGDLMGQAVREVTLDLNSGNRLYLYTDGVCDQLTENSRRWGIKRWKAFVQELQQYPFTEHKERLSATLDELQTTGMQTDDMLVVGIEIP